MIEAIITGIVAIAVCMINNISQQKNAEKQHRATLEAAEKQHNTTIALIEYKINELSKRVDKHNNVVHRVYELEQNEAVISEQIKVANHRIDDLERAKAGE